MRKRDEIKIFFGIYKLVHVCACKRDQVVSLKTYHNIPIFIFELKLVNEYRKSYETFLGYDNE